jgi:hypothetical protein
VLGLTLSQTKQKRLNIGNAKVIISGRPNGFIHCTVSAACGACDISIVSGVSSGATLLTLRSHIKTSISEM